MLSTTSTEARPQALPADASKPYFGQSSLDALVEQFNARPDLLEIDWRVTVRTAFRLSPEKALSLVQIEEARVEEIQDFFSRSADHIRRGGTLRGTIIEIPPEQRTEVRAHDVQIEMIAALDPSARAPVESPQMLRIAHCDANCRNWKWNSF